MATADHPEWTGFCGAILPERAAVIPRVCMADGVTLRLEDFVVDYVARGKRGTVYLLGAPGFGKSAALAHLAAVLPAGVNVRLVDGDRSHGRGMRR